MSILEQSTAVRTPVLPEVKEIIKKVDTDFDGVQHYKTSIVEWLKPIIDLSDYSVYPTNGITEGLNWWYYKEPRSVTINKGDYQWIKPKTGFEKIHYLSCPSSIDGNFINVPKNIPVALDLAYVGSTSIQYIEIKNNVEFAFFSLSKSFGIRNIRSGWLFTKTPDLDLELLTFSAKYYNYYAHDISETIISNFDIDYIYNRLKNEQSRVCNDLDLSPSHSVWLATTNDEKY
jgi:aspartate/methionine/tyrosine aminotransferase